MKKAEFYYLSADQKTNIHAMEWVPESTIRGVIQISHGITEHILRYETVATFLTKQGFVVTGNDHLGHGLSIKNSRDFMHCSNFNYLVEDVYALQKIQSEKYKNVPYYMLGFSLGSFVVRDLIARYPLNLSATIIMGTGMTPKLQLLFAHYIVSKEAKKIGEKNTSALIQKLSFETYNKQFKPNITKCDWLCKNQAGLEDYINDTLCGDYISAGLFRELLQGMLLTTSQESINKINKELPILLVSGNQDPVGQNGKGVNKVFKAFKKAKIKNVSMKLYPGRHDLLHEACHDEVLEDIIKWINQLK